MEQVGVSTLCGYYAIPAKADTGCGVNVYMPFLESHTDRFKLVLYGGFIGVVRRIVLGCRCRDGAEQTHREGKQGKSRFHRFGRPILPPPGPQADCPLFG